MDFFPSAINAAPSIDMIASAWECGSDYEEDMIGSEEENTPAPTPAPAPKGLNECEYNIDSDNSSSLILDSSSLKMNSNLTISPSRITLASNTTIPADFFIHDIEFSCL